MSRTTRPQGRKRQALLAFTTSLVLLAAACGSSTTEAATSDGVASIDDGAAPTDAASPDPDEETGGVEAPENPEDAFELFNQCMTDAGFDFGAAIAVGPGDEAGGVISVSPDGELPDDVDPQNGSGSLADFDIEEFETANEACEGHLANIDQGFDLSPEEQARMEDAQLEFSKCMEDQGFEMPDFSAGGSGIIVSEVEVGDVDPQSGQPSIDDLDFDEFNEAAQACDHVFEELSAELELGDGSTGSES